jgi:hypothetical protein
MRLNLSETDARPESPPLSSPNDHWFDLIRMETDASYAQPATPPASDLNDLPYEQPATPRSFNLDELLDQFADEQLETSSSFNLDELLDQFADEQPQTPPADVSDACTIEPLSERLNQPQVGADAWSQAAPEQVLDQAHPAERPEEPASEQTPPSGS